MYKLAPHKVSKTRCLYTYYLIDVFPLQIVNIMMLDLDLTTDLKVLFLDTVPLRLTRDIFSPLLKGLRRVSQPTPHTHSSALSHGPQATAMVYFQCTYT
jgi:hypothetical protein